MSNKVLLNETFSNTFRLFVSSTFSDFHEEREILQEKIFPKIKDYCSTKKLNFQAIDLRWGVSNEAQLDQKTLELCLEEVRNSKVTPYPNFLIMTGDRYGWIPLPYVIEQNEYENIFKLVTKQEDKELLNFWYELDLNQIPSSYILNERKNEYIKYETWEKVENRLRKILQDAVSKSNIKEKDRYFKSATEAEVIEGIFKYLDKTPFQNELLNEDSSLEQKDFENVYAYIRNIKSFDDESFKDKFVDKDTKEVQRFKETIRRSIKKENIFEVDIDLKHIKQNNSRLNYVYEIIEDEESIFEKTIIQYLKSSIDKYIQSICSIDSKDLERVEQKAFKNSKLKDFLDGSRTKALEVIDNYITNKEEQTLVIYGKSGLGKSSLIAKAIQESENKYKDHKIIYRFIASSTKLINTPSVLISILKEFGIDEEIRKTINLATMQEENEKIEDFYYRVENHLLSISQNTIIFLDAVDQLSNEDDFLWLPNHLQNNLKIIISALDDDSYKKDSIYFEKLKSKSKNLYALENFEENDAKDFVENSLKKYNRKITQNQMNYLINIYKNIKTPLYLSVAIQELRHWKSSYENEEQNPKGQTLAKNQKEIIKEFIENLTKLYHHNKEFIKRVFSYLKLTKGLSENKLIELLSSDEEFVKKVAPEDFHINTTKELPTVIWARLYSQIKEFLKFENIENQSVMKFFHREFDDAIENKEALKSIYEEMILLLQKLMMKYQDKDFASNRWAKLYVEVLKDYHIKYEFEYLVNNTSRLKEYTKYFAEKITNKNYLDNIFNYLFKEGNKFYHNNQTKEASFYFKIAYLSLSILYKENQTIWVEYYTRSLNNLASSLYSIGETQEAIKLEKEALAISKELYFKDKNRWTEDYTRSLNNLASSLYSIGETQEAIKLLIEALAISKEQYFKDKNRWAEAYTISLNNLTSSLKSSGKSDEEIRGMLQDYIDILHKV